MMAVPTELVPEVRALLARQRTRYRRDGPRMAQGSPLESSANFGPMVVAEAQRRNFNAARTRASWATASAWNRTLQRTDFPTSSRSSNHGLHPQPNRPPRGDRRATGGGRSLRDATSGCSVRGPSPPSRRVPATSRPGSSPQHGNVRVDERLDLVLIHPLIIVLLACQL